MHDRDAVTQSSRLLFGIIFALALSQIQAEEPNGNLRHPLKNTFLMGQPRPLFVYFRYFQTLIVQK